MIVMWVANRAFWALRPDSAPTGDDPEGSAARTTTGVYVRLVVVANFEHAIHMSIIER